MVNQVHAEGSLSYLLRSNDVDDIAVFKAHQLVEFWVLCGVRRCCVLFPVGLVLHLLQCVRCAGNASHVEEYGSLLQFLEGFQCTTAELEELVDILAGTFVLTRYMIVGSCFELPPIFVAQFALIHRDQQFEVWQHHTKALVESNAGGNLLSRLPAHLVVVVQDVNLQPSLDHLV